MFCSQLGSSFNNDYQQMEATMNMPCTHHSGKSLLCNPFFCICCHAPPGNPWITLVTMDEMGQRVSSISKIKLGLGSLRASHVTTAIGAILENTSTHRLTIRVMCMSSRPKGSTRWTTLGATSSQSHLGNPRKRYAPYT
jgi:hypothetical protein